jgi:putative FmdB family regulatory protein
VPVYEYGCKKCKREFEYEQRMSDPPKKKCEACGGVLERLISRTSFQLKGSGCYKDLYSSTTPAAPTSESGASDGAADAPTKPAAEGTPAAAADKPAGGDDKPAKATPSSTDAAPKQKKKAKVK